MASEKVRSMRAVQLDSADRLRKLYESTDRVQHINIGARQTELLEIIAQNLTVMLEVMIDQEELAESDEPPDLSVVIDLPDPERRELEVLERYFTTYMGERVNTVVAKAPEDPYIEGEQVWCEGMLYKIVGVDKLGTNSVIHRGKQYLFLDYVPLEMPEGAFECKCPSVSVVSVDCKLHYHLVKLDSVPRKGTSPILFGSDEPPGFA